MKSALLLAATLVATSVLTGCYSPQPTDEQLYGYKDLPKEHWYLLPADDSRRVALPKSIQDRLCVVWKRATEDEGKLGKVSPETQKQIDDSDQLCNSLYLTSADVILSNPTPDLNGQFESWDKRRVNDSMIYSQNLRALADEWSRFWLMERPGGTPYDTVNTSGRF